MNLTRRALVTATALAPLAMTARARGAGAAATETAAGTAPTAPAARSPRVEAPGPRERLLARLPDVTRPLTYDGRTFAGPGWDWLVAEARASEFLCLGEEHGLAEVPALARELFAALRPAGFDRLAIELSPPIAADLDAAARDGLDGFRELYRSFAPGPAFYSMREECELLVAARALVPGRDPMLWGLDYEVLGDRRLLARLGAEAPPSARPPLAALERAVASGREAWAASGDPARLFPFAGDPALVERLRAAWPAPSADAAILMETLAETLAINAPLARSGWESNSRRAAFNRRNLRRYLGAERARGREPKVLFKFGANHMARGVNYTGMFDLGTALAELAEQRGGRCFHLFAGGGAGARRAELDPATLGIRPRAAGDLEREAGLGPVLAALPYPGLAVVDLKPLRRFVSGRNAAAFPIEFVITVQGFDALLAWHGSTPGTMLA